MSDLQICRICLIKDVRGYKMDQYDLRRCYEQIIRGRVNEKEGLPLWFCYECAMLLYKYDKFKEKCGKGQIALRTMLWSKGLSYDSISLINRFSEAFVSPIEIMRCSNRVKTSTMKHKSSTANKKSKEPDLQYVPEPNLTNFENVTLPFEEDKTFPVVNPLAKDIKVEAEPPKDDPKPDDNDFDMDNHFDNAMPSNDDDSDDNIFLNQHKTVQKPPENTDIDIDNIMNEIMSNEAEISKPEKEPKPKNGKKPVKKGYKNVYGILIPKTASDKPKAKKFETKKKDMNPEHWKKINMSEEDAMLEFKQRASSDKFLKANFKCHECFKGFSKLDMLMRHAKHYHDEACGTFVCRFCHMRFGRRWALTRHMTEHYVMYQCRRCDMQFREKSALFHDDVHNGVIRKCEHCGKEFVHSSTYYTHLRMTHRSNHICTLCGASFVSELGLLKHKRIAHYEEKDAEPSTTTSDVQEIYCDKCDIKFVSRRAYDEHLANSNNHGESSENMKAKDFRQRKIPTMCTHCGQNFPSRQAYKKHHIMAHSLIPFDDRAICEVCGVSLSAGSVAQHMVTHTGERPYPCTMCDKRFTQKSAMKMHYRTVHLKQPYPKYPRRKPYRRKKKTEEIPQNDFTAFIRPGYYS